MTARGTRQVRLVGAAAAMLLVTATLAGCGGGGGSGKTKLTVFAAASLTESFTALAGNFEKDHPDVDVVLSFGSSTTLAQQVKSGSPADVIATADSTSMSIVKDAGDLEGSATEFATNTMVVVTPADNPGKLTSLDDLAGSDFVVCDPTVPCGAAAAKVLDNAGITAQPKSLEQDVKAVLTKVTLGEADAGIVYVTDARAAGAKVATIDIAPDLNVTNPYFIGVIKDSAEGHLANQWVDLVNSQAGQGVLADAGFSGP